MFLHNTHTSGPVPGCHVVGRLTGMCGGLTPLEEIKIMAKVSMRDMLQAGVHQGLDTVGSVLRNANQQLRPDPVIPKTNTGLCNVNMSTIEPDQIRGGCDKTLC